MNTSLAVVESDAVVVSMTKASYALAEAVTISQTKKILDVAAAAEVYARRQHLSEEAERMAATVKVEALRKLGEMLQAVPKNKGVEGKAGPGRGKPGTNSAPGFDDAPTLADLGLTKKESAVAQKLASLPDDAFQQVREGNISVAKAIAAVDDAKKAKDTPAVKPKDKPEVSSAPAEPSMAEQMADLVRERDAAVSAMNEALADNTRMGEVFDSDDRTAALHAENKKLRAQVSTLTQRVNALMNEKNEAVRAAKSWQRKAQQVAA